MERGKIRLVKVNATEPAPIGAPVELTITPKQAGEYAFTCQMQMYCGTLVVK